jgi:PhnB protein
MGLEIEGAPFFLHESARAGFDSPATFSATTVRVEVFSDDPDAFIARAVAAGGDGSLDQIKDHQAPWGVHRQEGFTDPLVMSGLSGISRR